MFCDHTFYGGQFYQIEITRRLDEEIGFTPQDFVYKEDNRLVVKINGQKWETLEEAIEDAQCLSLLIRKQRQALLEAALKQFR